MLEFLGSPRAQLVFLVAAVAALIAIGIYVISKVRPSRESPETDTSSWMTNFRELHAKGELSDAEYRTIKAMLAEQFQKKLKQDDQQA